MVYTITQGVRSHFAELAAKTGGLAMPVLALAFLLVAALSFSSYHGTGQKPYIPTKSQGLSANSTSIKPAATSSGGNHNSPPVAASGPLNVSSLSVSSEPLVPPLGSASPSPVSSPTPTFSGGMGGGDVGGTTSAGGTSPTGTITCTDTLSVSQVCTTCTPALTLQPGQKALLSADGTCVAVN